ncbi:FecR family protein [Microbacter margulisiae]|uniref:Ferric-dicitrate binding protein FerR (Iron transport regulator) n=1 Tax=Microbacter margulisiae TaxID=1350067 RepID=A0A7W5DPN8_9PORP|nr:FecR family protein [Microbacter margulisiae]MBB3186794.1 ferric-dicitrate binding protein FerR (iron transport regulator) [Microbacter margulisiae]
MITDIDNILLIKFLRKELTDGENQQVIDWLQAKEENKHFLFGLKEAYMLSQWEELRDKADTEAGWNELNQTLELDSIPKASMWKKIRTTLQYAAAIILLLSVGYFLRDLITRHPVQYAVVETSDGQQSTLILSDGTKVRLNENTKLVYPTDFNGSTRTVALRGEAYFEVVHNAKKPFMVNVGSYTVKDIGTKFDIDTYPDEIYSYTSLKEGEVQVMENNRDQNLITDLKAGMQLGFNRRTKEYFVRTVDQNSIGDWTKGQIVIKRETLQEVAERLQHKYDYNISVQNNRLDSLKYNITIENESLEEILNDIHFITPQVHYYINKKDKSLIFK